QRAGVILYLTALLFGGYDLPAVCYDKRSKTNVYTANVSGKKGTACLVNLFHTSSLRMIKGDCAPAEKYSAVRQSPFLCIHRPYFLDYRLGKNKEIPGK
ncbi:MAG: hypothetical protein ACLTAF_21765, partial [Blautia coccoides]